MDGNENILVSFYWFTDISYAHQLGLVKHFKIRQSLSVAVLLLALRETCFNLP